MTKYPFFHFMNLVQVQAYQYHEHSLDFTVPEIVFKKTGNHESAYTCNSSPEDWIFKAVGSGSVECYDALPEKYNQDTKVSQKT